METKIYYFTGTGNSLVVAKDLARGLKDATITQISKDNIENLKRETLSTVVKVGIVFPVYYYGLPLMVREFVEKLQIEEDAYIFAIATCGGSVGMAFKQLEALLSLKGNKLRGTFKILMPDNFQILYSTHSEKERNRRFNIEKEQVSKIARAVCNNETVSFKPLNEVLPKVIGGVIYRFFKPRGSDKNFWINEKCNGCGLCSKICPANNVEIQGGRPAWHNCCEQCLACMQWCPEQSIQYKKRTLKTGRYHHPDVKANELFQSWIDR